MSRIVSFGQARNATVTVLVDNRADMIVKSTDTVKRYTEEPLLAEHGFAALVVLDDGAANVLWDAGITRIALLENMRRLEIDPAAIDKIVLSHGHEDHTAAVADVLKAMEVHPQGRKWEPGTPLEEILDWTKGRHVPVITHPAAFRERWGIDEDGTRWGPILPPPRGEWEAAGAEIILIEEPYQLGPGCWVTGPIPRRSFERSGVPNRLFYRDGEAFSRDSIEEDQAIVINVQDKGLVVLAGCAHAGIVNTIDYAQEISGVDRVWAVVGGLHLATSEDEEVQRTIDEIKKRNPSVVSPSHCTGFKAIRQFAEQMPETFVEGLVGTTYLF